ncbi:MAG TPA: hypothetical protein VJX66_00500 [Amycolatopsis sp.]|nr:hypothetical protein [Amycolatopsis sp.]
MLREGENTNMRRSLRNLVILTAAAVSAVVSLAAPASANEPMSSYVQVGATTLLPGQTFTITETIYNMESFVVTSGRAALYAKEQPLSGLLDLVSCTGTFVPCYQYFSSFRGPVGDMAADQTSTVTFLFRVKDTVPAGTTFTLQNQLVGDNYAFDTYDGPIISIWQG